MICTSIKDKTYAQIVELLSDGSVEMAEIRLDLCPLATRSRDTFIIDVTIVPFDADVAKGYSDALVRHRSRVRFPSSALFLLPMRKTAYCSSFRIARDYEEMVRGWGKVFSDPDQSIL